jgi:hypothetical protein
MKHGPLLSTQLIILLALAVSSSYAFAQSSPDTHASAIGALLVKLKDPVYPAIARVAHIQGDVKLIVRIRKDGAVDSVEYVSGPPLLKRAAMDSAQASKFECGGCTEATTPYPVVYTFQFSYADCCNTLSSPLEVSESQHRIWITVSPFCICEQISEKKVRSNKCLYLWKCGSRPE